MSRSGYVDDCDMDSWASIRWRGAVASAMKGKRGQDFLRELLAALDALPAKRLIADDLVSEDGAEFCAIGCVGRLRGINMADFDPYDYEHLSKTFGIAESMVREIEFWNDDVSTTPEQRFELVRAWVVRELR